MEKTKQMKKKEQIALNKALKLARKQVELEKGIEDKLAHAFADILNESNIGNAVSATQVLMRAVVRVLRGISVSFKKDSLEFAKDTLTNCAKELNKLREDQPQS
jgi:hypothetical protein